VFGVVQDVHAPLPALHLPLVALLHVGLVCIRVSLHVGVGVWLGVGVSVSVRLSVGVRVHVGVSVWLGVNVHLGVGIHVWLGVGAWIVVGVGVGLPLVGAVVGLARVQRLARTVDAPIARGAIVRGRASAL
jgi:hypothetical protein